MSRGTPKEWLAWLSGDDRALAHEAKLSLRGTAPGRGIPVESLHAGLHDANHDVVFWSLIALKRLGAEASCTTSDVISLACSHQQFGIRQASAAALGSIAAEDRVATEALLKLLDDESAFVRREALQALIVMKNLRETDMVRIIAMRLDRDADVARWAEIAQRNIQGAV